MLTILLIALGALALVYFAVFAMSLRGRGVRPSPEAGLVSLVANFFDTLGIGSMAPTTAYFKTRRMVPDELIPATIIVGYAVGAMTQAFIFISTVEIEPVLLITCIASSVIGALFGASVAAQLPVRSIRLVMGIGLLMAASLFAASNLGLLPAGGTATSLPLALLVTAVVFNFALGILMNLGIGPYAPLLIALSLMGLDPRAAFPVMMGSSAFLMLAAGIKLLRAQRLDLGVVLAMAIAAVPAVLVAALIVQSLPLTALRWGVVAVVTYTGAIMLRDAGRRTALTDDLHGGAVDAADLREHSLAAERNGPVA